MICLKNMSQAENTILGIVNATVDVERPHWARRMSYKEVRVLDIEGADLAPHFLSVIKMIEKERKAGKGKQ